MAAGGDFVEDYWVEIDKFLPYVKVMLVFLSQHMIQNARPKEIWQFGIIGSQKSHPCTSGKFLRRNGESDEGYLLN